MTTNRMPHVTSALILGAMAICLAATSALIAFPGNPAVWQAGAWTLTAGLVGLLVLVPLSAYLLVTRRTARTKGQIAVFAIGLCCLAIVAIGSL